MQTTITHKCTNCGLIRTIFTDIAQKPGKCDKCGGKMEVIK